MANCNQCEKNSKNHSATRHLKERVCLLTGWRVYKDMSCKEFSMSDQAINRKIKKLTRNNRRELIDITKL